MKKKKKKKSVSMPSCSLRTHGEMPSGKSSSSSRALTLSLASKYILLLLSTRCSPVITSIVSSSTDISRHNDIDETSVSPFAVVDPSTRCSQSNEDIHGKERKKERKLISSASTLVIDPCRTVVSSVQMLRRDSQRFHRLDGWQIRLDVDEGSTTKRSKAMEPITDPVGASEPRQRHDQLSQHLSSDKSNSSRISFLVTEINRGTSLRGRRRRRVLFLESKEHLPNGQ